MVTKKKPAVNDEIIYIFYNHQKCGAWFTTMVLWSEPPSSCENLPPKTEQDSESEQNIH